MGQTLTLTASDHHQFGAYRADPTTPAIGSIIVLQEIFGINHHIRSVCDHFAALGYIAIAPALFDRIQPNFESGYSPEEVSKALQFVANADWSAFMLDIAATLATLKNNGPVAVVGFCLGGSLAYRSATQFDGLSAAVCYYGGRIVAFADETPHCPLMMHFGETDANIPLSDVEAIRKKRPECEIYVYPGANHGFNCDERASYHQPSAALSWERTLAFLQRTMG